MNDAEFRAAIVRALTLPVPDSEADYHGCQCADDYSRVYMARVWDVVHDADHEADQP